MRQPHRLHRHPRPAGPRHRPPGPEQQHRGDRRWPPAPLRRLPPPPDHPSNLRYLIDPRPLTDAQAFLAADLENRARADISDHDRARDYAGALAAHFENQQKRMAAALGLTEATLSRYLALANLPPEVLEAFPSRHACRVSHAARLVPILRNPARAPGLMFEARVTAFGQLVRREVGRPPIDASTVAARLAAHGTPPSQPFHTIRRTDDQVVATAAWSTGQLRLEIPTNRRCTQQEIAAAITELLARTDFPSAPEQRTATWTLQPSYLARVQDSHAA